LQAEKEGGFGRRERKHSLEVGRRQAYICVLTCQFLNARGEPEVKKRDAKKALVKAH